MRLPSRLGLRMTVGKVRSVNSTKKNLIEFTRTALEFSLTLSRTRRKTLVPGNGHA